jgi:hypothetical protein
MVIFINDKSVESVCLKMYIVFKNMVKVDGDESFVDNVVQRGVAWAATATC